MVSGFNKKSSSISPGRIAWNKFRSNLSGMTALTWVGLCIVVALLGYLITPDSAPFANTQHLELSAKTPGTRVEFLLVRKNTEVKEVSFFRKMFFGQQNLHDEIPISSYYFQNDSVYVEKYTGFDDFEGMILEFHMADVVFPLDSVIVSEADLQIFLTDGSGKTISPDKLRETIERSHLVSKRFYLGTDRFGRDMVSQVIIGARVSISVGFIAITIALFLGVIMGSLAGFFRGRTDNFIVWLINVVWSIPTLLLVIAITFALGKGFWQIFIAVGLTMWVDVARVVRGQIISLRENEYIEAARALGLTGFRIITRHLLPNITGPVVVISAANFASAILIEAGLSFLGIGVQPPMPSWGNMIRENYGFIILDKAYLAIIPGICIMSLVMAFMLIGNSLRDALDKSPVNY